MSTVAVSAPAWRISSVRAGFFVINTPRAHSSLRAAFVQGLTIEVETVMRERRPHEADCIDLHQAQA
jgi:hypothetical protein